MTTATEKLAAQLVTIQKRFQNEPLGRVADAALSQLESGLAKSALDRVKAHAKVSRAELKANVLTFVVGQQKAVATFDKGSVTAFVERNGKRAQVKSATPANLTRLADHMASQGTPAAPAKRSSKKTRRKNSKRRR